jgi:hypothetical protein
MAGKSINIIVQMGVESFELDVDETIGDRCDYGLLAHCTDPKTQEHYIASCPEPDSEPEVFLVEPITDFTVEETEFDDDPAEPADTQDVPTVG